MRRESEASLSLLLLASIASLLACAGASGAQEVPSRLQQLIKANSLDLPGKTPFHLKIAFQLYDLEGKPSDAGTLEEWWASPGASRVTITSQALKSTDPLPFDSTVKLDPREKFLIEQLIEAEVHPIPGVTAINAKSIQESNRTFGITTLTCLAVLHEDASASGRPPASFCADPKDNALRIEFEGGVSNTVRNGLASFHETSVSLDLKISYENRPAIAGKVTALQVFDLSKSAIDLSSPADSQGGQSPAGTVTVGRIKSKTPPIYPASAKISGISGTVVLHAIISKEGKIKDLFTIASPSAFLTGAATEAVRQWTYQPYLLNGQPTNVDTVININFNFHGPA